MTLRASGTAMITIVCTLQALDGGVLHRVHHGDGATTHGVMIVSPRDAMIVCGLQACDGDELPSESAMRACRPFNPPTVGWGTASPAPVWWRKSTKVNGEVELSPPSSTVEA
ncbi:hypothetical protein CYMTET_12416 [Cymbomonas tetramitiformis]|uniref:Uncharacterized protein n=1 Tax=Cymbomonas tetramitiformis TaxID=36881 RepID=A0AAE0GKG9_9CHLO|nr:hypothetical protein CYMTET_12416 [Cymbomonas tetramitiformis]